jgi:hypothetical protein
MGRNTRWRLRCGFAALAVLGATLVPAAAAGAANPWVRVAAPSPGSDRSVLFGVECSGVGVCTAAGYFSNASTVRPLVASTTNGTVWTRAVVPIPSPLAQLNDITCIDSANCTAVGYYLPLTGPGAGKLVPLILRLDDGSWSLVTPPALASPAIQLNSVDCVTETRCRAVGSIGLRTLVLRTSNGVSWFREASPTLGSGLNTLQSIDCFSNADCTAVGRYAPIPGAEDRARTLVLRKTGGLPWTVVSSPNPAPAISRAFLDEVSCATATTCVAVGAVVPASAAGGRGFILRTTNGATWTRAVTPTTTGQIEVVGVDCTTTVACTATGVVWSVAEDRIVRNVLLRTTNGTTWTSPSPESERLGRALFGVSCATDVACTSVGTFNDTGFLSSPLRTLVMRET